jgi:hypothetical protein
MPRCYFCKGRFFRGGWFSEAEPCDCGQCLTEDDARDLTPDEYAEAAMFARRQPDTTPEEAPDGRV